MFSLLLTFQVFLLPVTTDIYNYLRDKTVCRTNINFILILNLFTYGLRPNVSCYVNGTIFLFDAYSSLAVHFRCCVVAVIALVAKRKTFVFHQKSILFTYRLDAPILSIFT